MTDVDHRDRVRRHAESRLAAFRRHPSMWAAGKEAFLTQVVDTYELLYLAKHERADSADVWEFVAQLFCAVVGPDNRVVEGLVDDVWARTVLDKAQAYAATRMVP